MLDNPDQKKWEGMMRGQVMAATIGKFTAVIKLLDQKAQVMIFLNSILIPVCIKTVESGSFERAATISIVTSILSIFAAIVCIYPKRRHRRSDDHELNVLHFNDIGHMERQEYMDRLLPIFNEPEKLAAAVVYDLYDVSRYSILPKYRWLKVSYAVFALGNLLAIGIAFLNM